MGRVLLRLHWLCLKRDRLALVLAFVLPIAFYSIMTMVMKEVMNPGRIGKIEIGILDRDASRTSRHIIGQLRERGDFLVRVLPDSPAGGVGRARLLRESGLTAILVFPAGFERALSGGEPKAARVELLQDRANPIFEGILADMLEIGLRGFAQSAALSAMAGPGFEGAASLLLQSAGKGLPGLPAPALSVERVDVFGQRDGRVRDVAVAYWAAGVGVLFLLFAMAGAGAGLIDERESGILERVVANGIPLARLLTYKWLFFAALGFFQVSAMFLWGWLVYDVELFTGTHFWGFLLMTLVTALSAAALGVLLATVCRTRTQLAGVSTVLILVMSALGGSMFPRFLMSESLKTVGNATFNAWALDGYQKVFWSDASVLELWPQVVVLLAHAALCIGVALAIATRRASG